MTPEDMVRSARRRAAADKAVAVLRAAANVVLGAYKGIVFHTNKRIPNGVNSSTSAAVANTRRMAMLGAQSLNICWGRSYGNSKRWSWIEKTFGYEGQLGVAVRTIWGCKVSVYNSKYFGAMVLSTYTSVA